MLYAKLYYTQTHTHTVFLSSLVHSVESPHRCFGINKNKLHFNFGNFQLIETFLTNSVKLYVCDVCVVFIYWIYLLFNFTVFIYQPHTHTHTQQEQYINYFQTNKHFSFSFIKTFEMKLHCIA